MKTLSVLSLVAALFATPAAQAGEVHAGAQYVLVAPVADMADHFDTVGHGLDIELAYRFDRAWLAVGGSLTWAWLGDRVRSPGSAGGTGPDTLRLSTDHTATLVNAFVRFQPRFGIVYPYVEGIVGASFFNRTASLRDRSSRALYVSGERHTDIAFNWGAGVGVMIDVFKPAVGSTHLAIDLRLRYLGGLAASQYPAAAISETGGVPDIDKGASEKHDMLHTLLAHVGFIIMF